MKEDVSELKKLFLSHIIKLVMVIIIVFSVIAFVNYFNLFGQLNDKRLIREVDDAMEFKGFKHEKVDRKPMPVQQTYDPVDKSTNSHILIFGGSGSGKTHFVKKYLENHKIDMYWVVCRDGREWDKKHILKGDRRDEILNNMERIAGYTLIFDDQGNSKYDKYVSEAITKGRHDSVQIIFIGHISTNVIPSGRNNVKHIYLTTQNSKVFFSDIEKRFQIDCDLNNFYHHEYGIIKVDLTGRSVIVYDKDQNIVFDGKESEVDTFDITKYLNVENLSEEAKEKIKNFLESKADINITPPFLKFYLNYYLIEVCGEKPNVSKLKYMITDYYNEHNKLWISPIFDVVKTGVKKAL